MKFNSERNYQMLFRKQKVWIVAAALTALLLSVFVYASVADNTSIESKARKQQQTLDQYTGEAEYKKVDPGKSLYVQTSTFEIAGRTFEMPTVYIQSNLAGKRVLPDGINLLYVLPDFKPRAAFKNKEEYEAARKDHLFAHMLLEPEAIRPSFEVMIKNLEGSLIKHEYAGMHGNLYHYMWYRGTEDKPVLYYEIFLGKDDKGNIEDFIECATFERGIHIKTLGCKHRFRDNKLLYSVYYNKDKFFPQWKQQRELAIKFINSFEVKPIDPR